MVQVVLQLEDTDSSATPGGTRVMTNLQGTTFSALGREFGAHDGCVWHQKSAFAPMGDAAKMLLFLYVS